VTEIGRTREGDPFRRVKTDCGASEIGHASAPRRTARRERGGAPRA
jgi:hypothetical protein